MKKNKSTAATGADEQPKSILIESMEQLQAFVEAPLLARIILDGQRLDIPVQRLSAATNERIRALYRKARPPFNKMLKAGQGAYDEMDAKYLSEYAANVSIARSVVIYCHCPLVARQKTGLQDDALIHAFVNNLFSDGVLDTLALTIRGGGLKLEELVNFIQAPGLES